MACDIDTLKQRHMAFWAKGEAESPLLAFVIGAGTDSWSYWRDNPALAGVWGKGRVLPGDLNPAAFVDGQRRYLELSDQVEDDVRRTAMPLASVPWMEAILGCPMVATEAHFAGLPTIDQAEGYEPPPINEDNPWIQKYIEWIQVYSEAFEDWHPVTQSVLRGPSDLACSLLGPEKATLSLIEEPEVMDAFFQGLTDALAAFIILQRKYLPNFFGGNVIAQYELWAPGTVVRMQEDFSTLYSPRFYRRFLKPRDEQLANLAEYTLIHLHTTSLFLIDEFLQVDGIRVFQITKDPGVSKLTDMITALEKIQQHDRCLVLKGQFDNADLTLLKKRLSPRGLCLQPVADSVDQAKSLLPLYRDWS